LQHRKIIVKTGHRRVGQEKFLYSIGMGTFISTLHLKSLSTIMAAQLLGSPRTPVYKRQHFLESGDVTEK
jgi:hypothetical protein